MRVAYVGSGERGATSGRSTRSKVRLRDRHERDEWSLNYTDRPTTDDVFNYHGGTPTVPIDTAREHLNEALAALRAAGGPGASEDGLIAVLAMAEETLRACCHQHPCWREVHHMYEWQHSGAPELGNLVVPCGEHHRSTHHTRLEVRMVHGLPEFIQPSWIDRIRLPPVAHVARAQHQNNPSPF